MMFLTSIVSVILLLMPNAALASPLSARLAAGGGNGVLKKAGPAICIRNDTITEDALFESKSTNWAGAVVSSARDSVTAVQGSFTVPKPILPPRGNSNDQYCGAAWVGIDGDTCTSSLIQTGVFWCIHHGIVTYEAWYEYIPAASIAYSGISVGAGDVITVAVTRNGFNGGVATLENTSSGQSASHTFTSDRDGNLCGQDAEWIVEDFSSNGGLVPFANFGTITFTEATAVVNGETVSPGSSNADNLYIDFGTGRQTTTTFSGGEVTVGFEER
ncbi:Aspergillopepsin-2 [Lachnellula hyalina]|uniref:Aspergillopepsin-2 n=1 Tax=Lachnellula hyalina TaxID=1316788 RepID=A0A8H8R848_9HELO|nr:Aspergillopepsin-2 [Lachnellula hyalina]TVY30315.1 Aspergillopepsin-2 [Lachnellula hyalina]